MTKIEYFAISKYITDDNKLGEGKECIVYYYGDKVIKLFHQQRKTTIPMISVQGINLLVDLKLNCFNTPIDIIYQDNVIVGYTEKFLEEKEINFDLIDYNDIKNDIIILSENGFSIEDLFYNYVFTDEKLYFFDLTCYKYIKTDVDFLKRKILKNNIIIMNNFLIGLIHFDAFRKGMKNEYTKIYLANEYRLSHCEDIFYGDYINPENSEDFRIRF